MVIMIGVRAVVTIMAMIVARVFVYLSGTPPDFRLSAAEHPTQQTPALRAYRALLSLCCIGLGFSALRIFLDRLRRFSLT
jgi:hypothetical protein